MSTPTTHAQVETNGITLHVAACGPIDGPPVVLCHGFPELWYSWRHQLTALGDAGYRALAPDLRGYGTSSAPRDDVAAYGADQLAADLCGLLDHHGYERAAFVGHDWGALAVWELGKLAGDRVSAIYNMSVPYAAAPASPPVERLAALFGDRFFYILYFQPVGPAEAELEADARHFLRTFLYAASAEAMLAGRSGTTLPLAGTGLLDTLPPAPTELPSWLSEHDVDVFAEGFADHGFFGPLSYYRNLDANWARTREVPATALSMPTGFLTGALDPVKGMFRGAHEAMAAMLPDFRGVTEVDGAGHWVQQERPAEVNAALLAFLSDAT